MITAEDLIPLPYTPDLSEGGIAYACRSLAYTYNRMGGSPVDRLRRIVAGVAVELAFRRYLSNQGVPYDVLGATPFTDPDRYDVSLGGHRCDIKSFFITNRRKISLLRRDPSPLLQAPALVPVDQAAGEDHRSDDLYLFTFLLGLTAASEEDVDKAAEADQPVYLIHPLPEIWARPAVWAPIEQLVLKSECREPLTVEIGGQDSARNFITAAIELQPGVRCPVEASFYSLAYIHTRRKPAARLGLHSPGRGDVYLIPVHEWGNIWVYGLSILLAGYLTYEEYRRKARLLPAGSVTFQYDHTRTKNLLVPVSELHPLEGLLKQVREWEA